jgi:hypothetical protein
MPKAPPFVRQLFPPSSPQKSEGGLDVIGVKRAVSRAGFWPWQEFDDAYNERFATAVAKLKAHYKIKPAGKNWTEKTQTFVANLKAEDHPTEFCFDATAVALMEQEARKREKPHEQEIAEQMLAYCKLFHDGYCYGGEHDGTFLDDDPGDCFDCSSSCSSVLAKFGLLGYSTAIVSGTFMHWGEAGRGKYVTVHAASDHVWMEFTIPGQPWCRFDTSPHGCGSRGARVRTCMRDASRFVSRHPRGY